MELAETIAEATGYSGALLTQGTLFAAALFAMAHRDESRSAYFLRRAGEMEARLSDDDRKVHDRSSSAPANLAPGWNFGGPGRGSVD